MTKTVHISRKIQRAGKGERSVRVRDYGKSLLSRNTKIRQWKVRIAAVPALKETI